jgi:hypothetical protein
MVDKMTPGVIGTVIVAGVILVFGLRTCEDRREGRDDAEAARQDSIAAAEHATAIAQRDAAVAELGVLREERAAEQAYREQTARQIAQLTRAYDRISRNVGGGGALPADSGTADTVEVVGPRTLALIDAQQGVIARQDSIIRRDSARIGRLFGVADSLESAFAHLEVAYQAKSREAELYKRQRYGWKDRVTGSVCYTPLRADGLVDGGACYTVVRPLRAIDGVTDFVRRVF